MNSTPQEPFDWSPRPAGTDASHGTGTGSGGPGHGSGPQPGGRHRALWVVVGLLVGLPALALLAGAGVCLVLISRSTDPAEGDQRELERLQRLPTDAVATARNDRLAAAIRQELQRRFDVGTFTVAGSTRSDSLSCSGGRLPAVRRASPTLQAAKPIPPQEWAAVQAALTPVAATEGFMFSSGPMPSPTVGTTTEPGFTSSTGSAPSRPFGYISRSDGDVLWVQVVPQTAVFWRSTCHLTTQQASPSG